jgi:hypothetical protein
VQYRVIARNLVTGIIQQANAWTALRASIRLGMETPIGGVMEFARAIAAHLKMAHGRALAIVGNILDDGKSGTAIGAVDERIAIAPIRRIEKLFETIVTGRRVRRDQYTPLLFAAAADDAESLFALCWDDPAIHILYARERRRLLAQMREKTLQGWRLPLQLDGHARGVVQNESSQTVFHGESVDKRPEPDSLDNSFHSDVTPFVHGVPGPLGSGISASGSTW